MASKNDGLGMGPEFWAPLPGQDRKHFPLGTSRSPPGPNYFADAFGLANEQVIMDAIAGLTDPKEIEDALTARLNQDRGQAQDFMRWRLKMRKNAPRP